jgi:hypothetical protein
MDIKRIVTEMVEDYRNALHLPPNWDVNCEPETIKLYSQPLSKYCDSKLKAYLSGHKANFFAQTIYFGRCFRGYHSYYSFDHTNKCRICNANKLNQHPTDICLIPPWLDVDNYVDHQDEYFDYWDDSDWEYYNHSD